MAGNIKGITIEFQGDTTKLDKALRQIKNSTKDIDSELKQVNKALKFDPTSVELWRQKQDLLRQKIKETENNLKELKNIQAQMDAKGVDKNSEAYRRVQREITEAESKLKTFNTELRKIGQVNLRAMSEQFKEMGNKLTAAGQAMRGISTAAAATAAAIGALAVKSGEAADDLNTLSKRTGISTQDLQKYSAAANLVDVSVESIAKANKKLTKNMFAASNGSKAQAEAFKAIGVSVTDSNGDLRDSEAVFQDVIAALGKMENETERDALAQKLLGNSAAELNPLIEDQGETYKKLTETLGKYNLDYIDQETLDKANAFNDSLDTMKAIGSVAFQSIGTELAATLAPALEKVVELFGKFAEWLGNLDPKVLTVIGVIGTLVATIAPLLIVFGKIAFAISSITGLLGTAGISFGALAGPIGIAIAAIAAIIAIGVLLYKNWDTIKAKAQELWNNLKTTFDGIKKSVITAWDNIKTRVTNTVNNLKTGITTAWNNIKTAVSTAVNGLKTVITTIWNAIKTFITNGVNGWKSILSGAWDSIKSTASNAWNAVKSAITDPIKNAWKTVKTWIDKLKDLFPLKVGKIFSNLKIPHIKINGGKAPFGIGGKGEAPKISVDWYRKAMNNPYMFSTPTLFGAGEAGDEMLYGRAALMRDISEAVSRGGGQSEAPNITININGATADPREIADEVRRMLIQEANRRRLAW